MSIRSATTIFAATMLAATGLQAQTTPSPNAPQQRAQQQQRVQQQRAHEANQRIDEEYRKGGFTRDEAQALKLDERDVRQQMR